VTFSYSGDAKDNLYEHLDLGVDMDSRTALVGPNGMRPSPDAESEKTVADAGSDGRIC